MQLAARLLRESQPVEQHRKAGAVAGGDAAAVDLEAPCAALAPSDLEAERQRRGVRSAKVSGPCTRDVPSAALRQLQAEAVPWTARRAGRSRGGSVLSRLLPGLCLPIASGFSPDSRRLITASIPCCSICAPKSSR